MKKALDRMPGITFEEVFHSDCQIDYNVIIIVRVHKMETGGR